MSIKNDDINNTAVDDDDEGAQLNELKDAFVHALTANGVLGKIKAQLRASAVGLLRGDPDLEHTAVGRTLSIPKLSLESKVTLLLIHQFLLEHNMTATAGVFEAEGSLQEVGRDVEGLVKDRFPFSSIDGGSSEDCPLIALVREALNAPATEVTRVNSSISITPYTSSPKAESRSPYANLTESSAARHEPSEELDTDPNSEALDVLANTGAVAKVIREMEDSFEFSDNEGELLSSQAERYDRVEAYSGLQ